MRNAGSGPPGNRRPTINDGVIMSENKLEGIEIKVLIIVPNYWGKAGTIEEAWKNVRQVSGKNLRDLRRGNYQIYVAFDREDVKTKLDSYGFNFSYPRGYPPVKIEEHISGK